MEPTSINSRATYLKYRAEWRIEYKGLIKMIRKAKAERSIGTDSARSSAQSTCYYLRVRARTMMEQLELAKAKRPAQTPEQAAA